MSDATRPIQEMLTLCTVSFKSKKLIDLNWRLTRSLNPNAHVPWLIIENSLEKSEETIAFDDERFTVEEGLPHDPVVTTMASVSYHHALASNRAKELIKTRYVLFMDPDFFVIRPDWIRDLVAHVQRNKLAFFGCPYPVRFRNHYQDFPVITFLLIDLEQIPADKIDFTPEIFEFEILKSDAASGELLWWWLLGKRPKQLEHVPTITREMVFKVWFYDRIVKRLLPRRLTKWLCFYRFRDVGYDIYRTYYRDKKHPAECLRENSESPLFEENVSLFWRLYKWFVPEQWSMFAKKRYYTTTSTFPDFGLPDYKSREWDEFFWHDIPYAVHVAATAWRRISEVDSVPALIGQLLDGGFDASPWERQVAETP